ncbi:hypothetical protein CASFOL_010835 [Castilleja foliolosa]|uniref:Uncharacterized protein n=1 Tax=Castilleja foliolosa TaxID=1961234 RepID=A0ABD3DXR8_9LAMI
MEPFTLLNYRHTGGGGSTATTFAGNSTFIPNPNSGDDEDGPYFDLDFPIARDKEKSEERGEAGDEKIKGSLFSLFARDNNNNNLQESERNWASDEGILTKEVMQKYLKMLKPLYVRVSSRYIEKMKSLGQMSFPGGDSPPCKAVASNVRTYLKQGSYNSINLQAGLKVVRKHLGKNWWPSDTVAAEVPPGKMVGSNRRDGSLLQLEDGIQGAILHCKRSFDSCRG